MNFVPVIIISSILFVITILLAIADRLLVNYGDCKITIHQEDEEKEFTVHGGSYLLANLIDNDIKINSSCGGKATCGYCKIRVLSGGGQILPTEEIFMSREEKVNNTRLACQVKVKNDIEVYIPDFLTTVRGIIKNKTYDPKLNWRWIKADQVEGVPEQVPVVKSKKGRTGLGEEDEVAVLEVLEQYKDAEGALVPILQKVNDHFNYIPEPALELISNRLETPLSNVLRVATFYNAFSLKPRGKNVITVCLGTACHVKGAPDIISTFEKELGIKTGETTEDMLFTLDAVRCIGCCGLAPVLKVNEDVHGLMTRKKVPELIEKYMESIKS